MTIGIDASRANNAQKTGVEWYAFFLIQELKKITPPEIKVVLYSEKPLEGKLAMLPRNWSSKVLRWPPKRFWTQIRMSLEMVVARPDVLFIPAHVFPLIHPHKTVMTVHDVAAQRFPESYNWFERWYSTWSAEHAVKNLWQVIVPSIFTKEEIEKSLKRVISTNMTVIHHGFDNLYTQTPDVAKTKKVLEKFFITKPYFISIGRLEEKKNTARVIEAFTEFRKTTPEEYQLVLIGKPGYGYEKVEQAIQNSLYKEDILTPGWMPTDEVLALMQNAESLVFPSLYEGFGIPVLEGFAAGIPVITSNSSSTKEIGGGAVLLVNPENSKEIMSALQTIINNPALKQDLIQKGKQRLQDFSWEKCARETLALLTKEEV